MRPYVAGPMTWYPQFNYPAFDLAVERLRSIAMDPVSPAELDSPEDRAAAMASPDGDPATYAGPNSWGDFLARDVKLIADGDAQGRKVDSVIVLPGWEQSSGARLETFVAHALKGLPVQRMVLFTGADGSECWRLEAVNDIDLFRAWCAEPNLFLYVPAFRARENVRGTAAEENLHALEELK